jgi:predicted nucleic acid-binding protein
VAERQVLLDANVLIYAANSDAAHHAPSLAVVRAGLGGRLPAVLVPQVLLEFYAVVTSPRRVENPLSPSEAVGRLEALRAGMPTLPVPGEALDALAAILAERPGAGPMVFDRFLAAQMRHHGVDRICTYNVSDFNGITGLEAVQPEAIAAEYHLPQ